MTKFISSAILISLIGCTIQPVQTHFDPFVGWISSEDKARMEEIKKIGPPHKIPGKFRVVDKSSSWHGCEGNISEDNFPVYDLDGTWFYLFSTMSNCDNELVQFKSEQLKRLGDMSRIRK
jgi:hypothetical protein